MPPDGWSPEALPIRETFVKRSTRGLSGAGKEPLMFGLGAPELLIVLAIVVLLFGGTKLPQFARSLGQAQKEFRAGTRDAPVAGTVDDKN